MRLVLPLLATVAKPFQRFRILLTAKTQN